MKCLTNFYVSLNAKFVLSVALLRILSIYYVWMYFWNILAKIALCRRYKFFPTKMICQLMWTFAMLIFCFFNLEVSYCTQSERKQFLLNSKLYLVNNRFCPLRFLLFLCLLSFLDVLAFTPSSEGCRSDILYLSTAPTVSLTASSFLLTQKCLPVLILCNRKSK